MSCWKYTVRTWLSVFNIIEALLGIAFAGYGIYLAVKVPSTFSYLVIGVGASMVLVALLGYSAVAGQSSCRLTCYSSLLCLLFLVHLGLVIFVFVKPQTAEDWIADKSGSSEDVQNAEDFVKKHITTLAGISVAILVVEGLSFLMSLSRSSVMVNAREEWETGTMRMHSKSSRGGYQPLLSASATPVTDRHREMMNEKYGGVFEKSKKIPAHSQSTDLV